MLELSEIKKDYPVAGGTVQALKGISLKFRRNEFVSILGASGCGKTTLLNIIGGLDKYTSGDLIIEGKSTKQYKDGDWDTYRNHSIGFIFQSYHLIPHQTILQNVELALLISGVSKEERRARAIAALERVGLKDKLKNRPNQLSGGQAQRVAIARALINDPEIVLADEPTGALDSKTSVQIMELLKEISKDRLVIMVTHNPELAEQYSTRIIRLLDGEVVDDSRPYDGSEESASNTDAQNTGATTPAASTDTAIQPAPSVIPPSLSVIPSEAEESLRYTHYVRYDSEAQPDRPADTDTTNATADTPTAGATNASANTPPAGATPQPNAPQPKTNKGKKKKASMSIGMAMSLSLKNLLSKRKRTALVSVAGSIGIIGVSMVLAISAGVHGFIDDMQDDMLSGNPLQVTRTALDFNSLMDMGTGTKVKIEKLGDKVYIDSLIETLMGMGSAGVTNNVTDAYADYVSKMPEAYYNAVYYDYGFEPANNIYTTYKLDKTDAGEEISVTGIRQTYAAVLGAVADAAGSETEKTQYNMFASMIPTVTTFEELPDNYDYILSQYDIVATYNDRTEKLTENELKDLFDSKDSLIMVIDKKATTDLTMGQMGYFTQQEFLDFAERAKDISAGELSAEEIKEKYAETLTEYLNGKEYDYFLDKGEDTKFKWYPNDTVYSATDPANNPVDAFYKITTSNGVGGSAESKQAEYKYNVYANGYDAEIKIPNMGSTSVHIDGFKSDRDTTDDVNLKVKVILQKKSGVSYGCLNTGLYYTNALANHALETGRNSKIVKAMNDNGGSLDFLPYIYHYTYKENTSSSMYYLMNKSSSSMMTGMMAGMMGGGSAESNWVDSLKISAATVGGGTVPVEFAFYPLDFDSKDLVTDYLDKWNDMCERGETYVWTVENADGTPTEHSLALKEEHKITYTDTVGLIIQMVNMMIEMITIALVAFTALSLVVSTVMIGIITYVSVVERIKEIGILRAVGARKKDIKRLFNAETFMVGLAAGVVGILVTYLLSLMLNLVLGLLFGIYTIAALPIWQALIMICISVVLTLISGLIPASAAAKKDPVVALRTE